MPHGFLKAFSQPFATLLGFLPQTSTITRSTLSYKASNLFKFCHFVYFWQVFLIKSYYLSYIIFITYPTSASSNNTNSSQQDSPTSHHISVYCVIPALKFCHLGYFDQYFPYNHVSIPQIITIIISLTENINSW